MQKLTNKEEEIMHILWRLEKAFVKDVLAEIKVDKPHYNTLSTIIRNLEDKGYVGHKSFGTTHQYYPIIQKKDEYQKTEVSNVLKTYFSGSPSKMMLHFAKEDQLSEEELKEIMEMIQKRKAE